MSQINLLQLNDSFQVRPRFKIEIPSTTEQLQQAIKTALTSDTATCIGFVNNSFGTLSLPTKEQHYWSPQLSFTFEPSEKSDTQITIRGLFGPRPNVWTMFIFFYSLITFAILVIAIIGLSYWSLGKSLMILWWIPVLLMIYASLFLVAYSGQKLGQKQMTILNDFFNKILGELS